MLRRSAGPIRSVNKFLEQIDLLYKRRGFHTAKSKRESWESLWFRGQQRSNWGLVPKIYRPEYADADESEIRQEFQSKAVQLLQNRIPQTSFEWYFLMQHFGVPTRLLDWTDNPLIALYFSVEDGLRRFDSAVWVLDPSSWNDSLEMTFGGPLLPDWQESKQWLFELEACFSTNTSFSQEFPAAIDSPHVDRRLAVQGSHFTIFGKIREMTAAKKLLNKEKSSPNEQAWLEKIEIEGQYRARILEQLQSYGISHFSVFADLQNLGIDISVKWRESRP